MPLQPGDRLGSYEILSALGEGGMGAVYRALDTRVGREVAVKVLLDATADDPQRAVRFAREAKVLASLNHPNVAHLYGYERAAGVAGGEVSFLAMELVGGETLAERIARGPIPWRDAIPLFDAIAAGLKAAHELGIVHRDLKPANVKIDEDEVVKVLDFGLASEPLGASTASSEATQSPTLTAAATIAGTLLGTAAYMAPEQARGKRVDRRADVWAFGCCLFEALAGRRPFWGEDVSTTLAAVLAHEPDWSLLPEHLPDAIRTLLRRCLHKDPAQRLQDLGEARWWLARALEPAAATQRPLRRRPPGWALAALALAPLLLGIWLGGRLSGGSGVKPPRRTVTRFDLDLGVTRSSQAPGRQVAFAPNGESFLVAIQDGSGPRSEALYRHDLVTGVGGIVEGTSGARDPMFDDEGRWIAFIGSDDDILYRLPVEGGLAQPIADLNEIAPSVTARGQDWRGDRIVLALGPNGLWSVSPSNGRLERLGTEETIPQAANPVILEDPPAVLFADGALGANLLDLATNRVTGLGIRRANGLGRLADGDLLWSDRGALWTARLERGVGVSTPRPVLAISERGVFRSPFHVTASGALVLEADIERTMTELGPDGGVRRELVPAGGLLRHPRWSPDGRTVAFTRGGIGSARVWLYEPDSGRQRRLTEDSTVFPVWTRDGRIVYFHPVPRFAVEVLDPESSAPPTVLLEGDRPLFPTSVSPSGIVLVTRDPGDILQLDLDAPGSATPWLESPAIEDQAAFSPDGEWVAYQSDQSGRVEVWIRRFDGASAPRLVSVSGGSEPAWAPDGKRLYYRIGNSVLAVPITRNGSELTLGSPTQLFERPLEIERVGRSYDPTPGSDGFVAVESSEIGARFTVILGVDELIRRQSAEAATSPPRTAP
jgi:eukaryotic-like serine/threonine-protein kinase